MLINNGDGTHTGGALDVLLILHDVTKNRYHAAFFTEAPMPGPIKDVEDVRAVRLQSRMHHTVGSDTLEGAIKHLNELATKILLPPENVWREPHEWDGELGVVLIVGNWRRQSAPNHA